MEKEKLESMPWAGDFLEMTEERRLKVVYAEKQEESSEKESYLQALKRLREKRTEVLAFADSVSGVLAVKEAGLRVVYAPEFHGEKEPGELPYYQKITDLLEGAAILRRMS